MNLRCWSRRLAEGWRAWRRRRYWTSERQLDYLRTLLQADHRWLAHDKTADALTTRYLAALAPDWYSRVHADACGFRREIGLEPLTAFSALNSTAVRKPPNSTEDTTPMTTAPTHTVTVTISGRSPHGDAENASVTVAGPGDADHLLSAFRAALVLAGYSQATAGRMTLVVGDLDE